MLKPCSTQESSRWLHSVPLGCPVVSQATQGVPIFGSFSGRPSGCPCSISCAHQWSVCPAFSLPAGGWLSGLQAKLWLLCTMPDVSSTMSPLQARNEPRPRVYQASVLTLELCLREEPSTYRIADFQVIRFHRYINLFKGILLGCFL